MKNNQEITKWLNRAEGNLERAKIGKLNDKTYYEDLCFDCQQAVEKSLKALLLFLEIEFPWTHSIAQLNKLISTHYNLDSKLKQAESLSLYAAQTRYPGDYEPLTDEDYKEALMLSEYVYSWVVEKIGLL
jgi:HEPN domain-containing protein